MLFLLLCTTGTAAGECRKTQTAFPPKHNNNLTANPPPSFPQATFYIKSSETETIQAQKQEGNGPRPQLPQNVLDMCQTAGEAFHCL